MEKKLNECLNQGEHVLWSGKSAPFALLDQRAGNGRRIVFKWIAEVVLSTALLAAYLKNNDPASPVFLALVCGVTILLILSPFIERRNILGTRYWITDQRVILMQGNKSIFSLRLEHVDAFQVVRDEAPSPCLVLGSGVLQDVGRQLRWRCSHPMDKPASPEDDNTLGMVLYNVENLDEALPLLNQQLAAA